MSTAARARRTRRGTRQYLPIVLGLAFLASAVGAEQGHHPAAGTADLSAPARAQSVISVAVDRPAGDQLTAESRTDRSGTVAVPAGGPGHSPLADAAPRATAAEVAELAGRAPAAGGPRAPPRPGV
jgi:hypothetical protein